MPFKTGNTIGGAMDRTYNFPVWATQGGGLVRQSGETYIFVTTPDCPGLGIGDFMPEGWGLVPANGLARQEMSEFEEGDR